MSANPKVRFKSDLPVKKILLDDIANMILNTWNRWFYLSIIRDKRTVFITGSYVYKHLVRGEAVNDLDVLCNNSKELSDQIKFYETL